MGRVPERSKIDEQYKWDLNSVYDGREEWERDVAAAEQYIAELQDYEGQLLEDAETLHEALLLKDQISRTIGTLNLYAKCRKRAEMDNSEYQELVSRIESLSSKSSQAKSFIGPEIQSADRETVKELVDEHEPLQVYDRYIDGQFRYKEHTLDQEQEELISQIGEVLGNERDIHSNLMNTDMPFPTVEDPEGEDITVTPSNRVRLLKHPDRDFRKRVYEAFADAWSQYDNTLASNYANRVQSSVIFADIRDHDSVRSRKLKSNKIPEDVYDNLIETVKENTGAVQRKRELLADILDVDELESWDAYMPLATTEEPEMPYEDAVEHVLESLMPLGDEYVDAARTGIEDEGWVDVYPNDGKRSGAFSWGTYDTNPVIFMNYEDDIDSMYTLAHELGHAMHSYLANQEQPYQKASYPIFSAEVASTVNEALLTEHLLDTVEDDAFREHVKSNQISSINGTLFTQTRFADFEHRAHRTVEQGDPLTVDTLDDIYGNLIEEYYGNEPSETQKKGWMRVPHFYRQFYVYQYATGISAALSLSQQILDEDDPNAADRYTDFLKSGGSDYPIPLLQDAGVDLTSPEPVEDAIDVYEQRLDDLERTLDTTS